MYCFIFFSPKGRPIFARKDVIIAGDTVLLEVEFVSTPKPDNISWYKNNNVLNKNKISSKLDVVTTELPFYGTNISTPGLLSILELQTDLKNRTGSYSCIIRNAFGYIDVSFDEKDIMMTIKRNDETNLARNRNGLY